MYYIEFILKNAVRKAVFEFHSNILVEKLRNHKKNIC